MKMFRFCISLLLMFFITSAKANLSNSLSNKKITDTLVVGYNINPPFVFHQNNKLVGLSYQLWEKIIEDDDSTLYQYVQLPLDSLLLGLKNGNVDVAISPLTITSKRNKYIDFSAPYFISNSGGIVRHSTNFKKLLDITSTIFSLPFLKVIGYLILLLTVFGFLVWIFERKRNKEQFGDGIYGLFHGIWWSAVTMTTVGYGDKTPKTLGGRIISLIWMFSGVILISTITASITSSLTVKKMGVSSEKVETYKNYRIGTVSNSATERWLNDNFFNNVKSYHTFDELFDKLRKDEIEIIAYDEPLLRYVIKLDTKNEFDLLKLKYNLSMYSFGFNEQLDKTKKEFITTNLLDILESSEWKRLLGEFNLLDND